MSQNTDVRSQGLHEDDTHVAQAQEFVEHRKPRSRTAEQQWQGANVATFTQGKEVRIFLAMTTTTRCLPYGARTSGSPQSKTQSPVPELAKRLALCNVVVATHFDHDLSAFPVHAQKAEKKTITPSNDQPSCNEDDRYHNSSSNRNNWQLKHAT